MHRKDTLLYDYTVRLHGVENRIITGRGSEAITKAMFKAVQAGAAIIERVEYLRSEDNEELHAVHCQIASFDNSFGLWVSVMNCLRAERAIIVQTLDMMYEQGHLEYPMPFYTEDSKSADKWLEIAAKY